MKNYLLFPALVSVGLLAAGCEKKTDTVTVAVPAATPVDISVAPQSGTKTLETARLASTIDTYVATPSAEHAAEVRKAFAELDGEIAELQSRVASTTGEDRVTAQGKLSNLQAYRAKETVRYNAANLTEPMTSSEPIDTRSGAEKVGSTLEKAGDKIKDTAENVGDKIKDATGN